MEADFLRVYGVDLLDIYRGGLTLRRVCLLVRHLPPDAVVWRVLRPEAAGWSRAEALTAAVERRVTALWATVTAALGGTVDPAQLTPPWQSSTPDTSPRGGESEPVTTPLRDIALMMREGV